MSEWQPIETALRNGTEVLVWTRRAGVMGRLVAHYTEGGGDEQPHYGPAWFAWSPGMFHEIQPTHWMPLPEPPK